MIRVTCVCSAAVTKFSRYNESSDSDEGDSSGSESSSSDDDVDNVDESADQQPASSHDNSQPKLVTDTDVSLSLANSQDDISDVSGSVLQHSPTQPMADAEMPAVSEEWTDLTTDTGRRRSASAESRSSSLSSGGTPPPPISSPLQLESAGQFYRQEVRKDVPAFRHRKQRNASRSPPRKYESSPSRSGRLMSTDLKSEKSPLRSSNNSWSRPVKNSASTSDLPPLSHPVSEKSSLYRHSATGGRKSPLGPVSRELKSSSDGRCVSRSYSSEKRTQSPPRSRYDDSMDRRKCQGDAEYLPSLRSRSRLPSVDKALRTGAANQQRSRSKEKDLPRSQSRSPSRSRSRSQGGFVDFRRKNSPSRSRSGSPLSGPYHGQTRSGSDDRRPYLLASCGEKPFAVHTSTDRYQPTKSYKDVARRQSSRSPSTQRTLSARYTRDVSPQMTDEGRMMSTEVTLSTKYTRGISSQLTAEDRKMSPYRSYRRSPTPDAKVKQPSRTDAKASSAQEFAERARSRSRSLSRHRSRSPRLTERRNLSPVQHEKRKLNDGRQNSERYLSGHTAATTKESIARGQPEVQNRSVPLPSRVRKRSTSSDRHLASGKRSTTNVVPVLSSLVSRRRRTRDRSGRSPPRTNEVIRSYVKKRYSTSPAVHGSDETKTNPPYKSPSPDDQPIDKPKCDLPVILKTKSTTKSVVSNSRDASLTSTQNKYKQNLADSPPQHPRTSADKFEDSSAVARLKTLAEPDKFAQEKVSESDIESSRSPHRELDSQTEGTQDEAARSEAEKTNTRKALTLKRPAAPGAAILEARKRRFAQPQDADSRSVCVRASSESHAKLRRQDPPVQGSRSKQLGKHLKESVNRRETAGKMTESVEQKTSGKLRMDMSDISDLTSADSSLSLEDISEEDESTQVRDRRFGERSDLDSTERRPGHVLEIGKRGGRSREVEKRKDGDGGLGIKPSAVSSVVKSVKKDAEISDARRPVETAVSRSPPATEAESADDDLPSSEDGIVVNVPARNVVSKG